MGLYDYGARWYDAAIGRFVGTDRFAEKYYPLSPYGYVAGNPVLFVDVNGDSIKYANADIQAYVERYSSETVTRGNGKVRLNRNYDPEFAKIINALEKSEFTFRFTDDGSGLNSETLGQVESTGDSKAFDVIVPDHSKTSKSSEQDIFGGRGAILAEETYHAFQVSEGHVVASTQGKGFVKGTSTIAAAEVDAKIWAAARPMTRRMTTFQGVSVPTIASIIGDQKGNRMNVLNIITKGTQRTISKSGGGSITVTYPPSYKFK